MLNHLLSPLECRLAEIVYAPDPTSRYIPPPTSVIPFNLSVSNYTHPTQEEPEPVTWSGTKICSTTKMRRCWVLFYGNYCSSVDLCIPTRLVVCTLPQVWWGFECDWLCQFVYKAKPAPDWDRGRTLEVKRISAVFKLNRKLLKEKYSDPRYQPFRLRTLERPTNLETIREEVVSHPIDFRDHGNQLWNLWFLTNNMVH
jgi:hypothetical protein